MWMIVGLGNPGPNYAGNRHNIGFQLIDYLSNHLGISNWSKQSQAEIAKTNWVGQPVLFVKPQTFMNLSGQSVIPLMNYYKIPLQQVIVAHDEIDQPFGVLKIQQNRGHGGHNGIRSISELAGSMDYVRLRMGVGRPEKGDVANFVLANFTSEQKESLANFFEESKTALEMILKDGVAKASSLLNQSKANQNKVNQSKKES